jgi:hypothetical protein
VTVRVRVCVPLPHVLVHPDHKVNAEVAQCTGQGPLLHACDSASAPHVWPPQATAVAIARERE